MLKLSFVILTKNEEKNLERCLKSIQKFADEIIIIDEFSHDKTIDVAGKFNAVLIQNENSEDFGRARNLGLEKAKNEWVFFVDADEILKFQNSNFKTQIENSNFKSYKIKRVDEMWGREIKHGENGRWNEIRLMSKDAGCWMGEVHERFEPEDEGGIGDLKDIVLKHYPHQSVSEFLDEVNFYSELRAKELFEQGIKSNVWKIILYPFCKFVLDYFLWLGFLDGAPGFVIAAMMSLHAFLVRTKLYLLCRQNNK